MLMLEIQDIHTYYGNSYILQGISLTIEKGSLVSILGRNGVGKTTLIRSIMGFNPPRRGKIVLKDHDITHMSSHERVRLGLGIVPQGRQIFPSLSVKENIDVACRPAVTGSDRSWDLKAIWKLFPRLAARQTSRGNSLSGGEQQMLAAGRALVGNHEVLLMDEPSEGLSPLLVRELKNLILDLKKRETSILLVEQNLSFALPVSDYIHVMNKGRTVYQGGPEEFWRNKEVKAQYLGSG